MAGHPCHASSMHYCGIVAKLIVRGTVSALVARRSRLQAD
jgi:hypothetical protein